MVGLGGGYYKFKGVDGIFGFSGKFGLQCYLCFNVVVKFDLGYFSVLIILLVIIFGMIFFGVKWVF